MACLLFIFLLFTTQINNSHSSASSFINSSSSLSSGHLCHANDSSALLQFKNSFSINTTSIYTQAYCPVDPKTVSWDKDKDCCTWNGVTCQRMTGHVVGLNLGCSGLEGNIHDNSSLFSLAHLQRLNLSANDFRASPISSKFGGFVSLTHLDLSYCNFSGPIPSQISHLSKLLSLNISQFFGPSLSLNTFGLKRIAQNLTNLRELSLGSVNMSSVNLPDSVMNLSYSLTSLILSNGYLGGKFPQHIFCLPNLRELDLSYNYDVTGSFPKSNWSSPLVILNLSGTKIPIDFHYLITTLKSLTSLFLSNCHFVKSYVELSGNATKFIQLDLANNSLRGEIPWSLLNLEQLTHLDLSRNNFVGQLPEVHNNATQVSSIYDSSKKQVVDHIPSHLITLLLSYNSLNGTIPSWLYGLQYLESLILSYNQLTGNIDEFQSNSLRVLFLDSNMLHGMIPGSIFQLVHLESLWLSSNNLSGVVEFEGFSKLQNLVVLDLSNSHLSVSFNNVSNHSWQLTTLYLSSCNITEFPYFFRFWSQLQFLDLSHNQIQGNLPTWLFDSSLYSLDLSHNQIQGNLSTWLFDSSQLQVLDLSHNQIQGNLSTGTVEQLPWKNLRLLDLRSNLLQGQLPIPPPSTYFFSISNNQLTGGVPSSICNRSSLQILDLSNNSLSGEIPACLGNISRSLSVLDLRNNKFVGLIPTTFGNVGLQTLNLNGNQLQGPVPKSLLSCRNLEILDLGNNKLNDTFPNWLESLPTLQVLILRSNRFHGPIGNPQTRVSFRKLRIMDLSHNQFGGFLPTKYFQNMISMKNLREEKLKYMKKISLHGYYQDTVMVAMKDSYVQLERIQTMFTTIDFSNNIFGGEIPKVLSKLQFLKGLNFSHNNLTGPIPPSLGNLTNLEWLDISSNWLVGEIPRQLADLPWLAKLNLSENQLVGRIPTGRQFDTFGNDSYSGNLGLCGVPLSKTCNGRANQPPTASFQEEDNSKRVNGLDWTIVLIGYGSGMVIGISIGYIVFSNQKLDLVIKKFGRKIRRKMIK